MSVNKSDYQGTIEELFRKYVPNTEPDRKLVKYWANALAKGDKDMHQFLAYVANHTDYLNHVKYTFIDMYYDHLSTSDDIDIGKMFDKMIVSRDADVPMTEDDVWAWLCTTDVFERQYTEMIDKMFLTMHDRMPTNTEVQSFISRLKENRAYTVDMMQRDIGSPDGSVSQSGQAAVDEGDGTLDEPSETDPISKGTADANSKFRNDLDIVAAYEKTFDRNMNVREYILYIGELREAKARDNLEDHIVAMNAAHNHTFAEVKEIMHMYIDSFITENEFIDRYLSRAKTQNFLDVLKHEVFDSDEYKAKMMERLKTVYFNMYGEKMTSDDALYMFDVVKKQEVELVSDELNHIVADFKAQNDEVVQQIFDIFFDVFDREPDVVEQSRYLAFMRERKAEATDDNDKVKDDIVLDLKQSLEYNDVLKKKINKAYARFSTDALFPSKVYHVLDKIVPIKHYKDIDQRIEIAVQEMLLD
jgi:hypothetical protein